MTAQEWSFSKEEPKAPDIIPFEEDADAVEPFLTAYNARFMLQPHSHSDEKFKILVLLSLCKEKTIAGDWAKLYINSDPGRDEDIDTYNSFVEVFKRRFEGSDLKDCVMDGNLAYKWPRDYCRTVLDLGDLRLPRLAPCAQKEY